MLWECNACQWSPCLPQPWILAHLPVQNIPLLQWYYPYQADGHVKLLGTGFLELINTWVHLCWLNSCKLSNKQITVQSAENLHFSLCYLQHDWSRTIVFLINMYRFNVWWERLCLYFWEAKSNRKYMTSQGPLKAGKSGTLLCKDAACWESARNHESQGWDANRGAG